MKNKTKMMEYQKPNQNQSSKIKKTASFKYAAQF